MNSAEYATRIVGEIGKAVSEVSNEDAEKLVEKIIHAKRVFVAGAGRSGFMVKAFAMRLMHIGIETYVVGETTTPGIGEGDLLMVGSGTGETGSLVVMAERAKKVGADVALVTIFPESSVGKLSAAIVTIPAPTPKAREITQFHSIQPMGSLFEQSLLIFLDATILRLMERLNRDSKAMFSRHANLE